MRNHINIFPPIVITLPGSGTVVSPAFPIKDYISFLSDAVAQRLAGDATVLIDIQQSNDGVLWVNPLFSNAFVITAAAPKARIQTGSTPGRRFARVVFVNLSVNAIQIEHQMMGKTNA